MYDEYILFEDEDFCIACNGTGEGYTSETACMVCKGKKYIKRKDIKEYEDLHKRSIKYYFKFT